MSVVDAAQLKENLRQSFRKACLKRLEGQEAEAVKILQEELPPKVKAWQERDECRPGDIEALFSEELARTESSAWLAGEVERRLSRKVQELLAGQTSSSSEDVGLLTREQAEAMQAVLAAKLQLELETIRKRLDANLGELLTIQSAEALGGRISQTLSEGVRAAVTDAFSSTQNGRQKVDVAAQFDDLRVRLSEISEKVPTGTSVASELAALEKREMIRWADRQGSWSKALDGLLRREDMEAALWQAQNAISERIENKTRNMDTLSAEMKSILASKLEKVVTAETFESRLMASVAMLHDAFVKALQDTQNNLSVSLEKRISESSAPIYQKVSSLITFADWERVQREANERFASQLSAQIEEDISQVGEGLGARQGTMEAALSDRMEALLQRLQDFACNVGASQATLQKALVLKVEEIKTAYEQKSAAAATDQKSAAEKLVSTICEAFEEQRRAALNANRDFSQAQAQALGMISVQQQNLIVGVRHDLEELTKAVNALAEQRKEIDEASRQMKQIVPQLLQNFERLFNERSRELETNLTEAFAKRLKTLRVVAD